MRYEKLSASLHAAIADMRAPVGTDDLVDGDVDVDFDVDVDLGRAGGIAMLQARTSFVVLADDVHEPPEPTQAAIRLFVETADGTDLDELVALGVRLDGGTGRFRPATVPIEALDEVSEDERVERLTVSSRAHPHLHDALAATNVPSYVDRTGRTGAGVVIGIVDTGIDWNHATFGDRIERIWDQTVAGPGVPEGDGQEHVGLPANGSIDADGHGTHVASIAAGADGVAPAATLVIVKTDFDTSRIVSAVRYIFRIAGDRPAVANLSLGSHNNSHDGLDPFSQAIDEQTGSGRIVCASAGNEGGAPIHGELFVEEQSTHALGLSVDALGPERVWVNCWYSVDDELDVRVVSPAGNSTPAQGPLHGQAARTYDLGDGFVVVTSPRALPDSPGHNVTIELQPEAGRDRVTAGEWSIEVDGVSVVDGVLHAWLMDAHTPRALVPSELVAGETDAYKVGAPAVGDDVIAVAAAVTSTTWTDASGDPQESDQHTGDIASFSSPGPRRDDAAKPDIAAPGSMIIAARSSHAVIDDDRAISGELMANEGTSMSCPFVSGVVALLLEGDPDLDPSTVLDMLQRAAAIPGQSAGAWDPAWGYGLVDVDSL